MTQRRSLILRAAQMAMMAGVPQRIVLAQPDVTQRRLRFTLQISNPESRALERPSVWLYGPMKATGTQELLEVRVSVPHELSIDALGQSIIALHLPSMAPLATRVVNISASLALCGQPIGEAISDEFAWLGQDRFVEVGDASIRDLAGQLRRQDQAETARAIYEWVRANIQYDRYLADDVGASEALRTRRGDCTEYAYLCTALARVNGIRARTMGGYVVAADIAPRAADYHNWAQFHLRGSWRTVDAQRGRWWEGSDYVAFQAIVDDKTLNSLNGAHRFRSTPPLSVVM